MELAHSGVKEVLLSLAEPYMLLSGRASKTYLSSPTDRWICSAFLGQGSAGIVTQYLPKLSVITMDPSQRNIDFKTQKR